MPTYPRARTLPEMLGSDRLSIITFAGAWNPVLVGTGGYLYRVDHGILYTGVNVNSSAFLYKWAAGLRGNDGNTYLVDWDKKMHIFFAINRQNSDTQVVSRVQLKQANALGQLAALGIGLEINNYTLASESYGVARGNAALGVTLTNTQPVMIEIIHYPGVKIEWYVDRALCYTETTANNIPSGDATNISYFCVSTQNGAAGGVDAQFWVMRPMIWQEF